MSFVGSLSFGVISVPTLENNAQPSANVLIVQRTIKLPFTVDIALVSHGANAADSDALCDAACVDDAVRSMTGDAATTLLADASAAFHRQFDASFPKVVASDNVALLSMARAGNVFEMMFSHH